MFSKFPSLDFFKLPGLISHKGAFKTKIYLLLIRAYIIPFSIFRHAHAGGEKGLKELRESLYLLCAVPINHSIYHMIQSTG